MAKRDSNGRFKPGQSGNPNGRPARADELRKLLADGADEAAEAVLQAARGGDMAAARLVLERLVPAVRPAHQPVRFALDESAPLAEQGKAVLAAIAQGELPPDQGRSLLDALAALARVAEIDEMRARIEALEGKSDESH